MEARNKHHKKYEQPQVLCNVFHWKNMHIKE